MKVTLQVKTYCILFVLLLISFAAPSRLWREQPQQYNQEVVFTVDTTGLNYFIYRGRPTGIQLELLQHYIAHTGINPKIEVIHSSGDADTQNDSSLPLAIFCGTQESDSLTNYTFPISLADGNVLWKTDKRNLALAQNINRWYADFKETSEYKQLMCRYFDASARRFSSRNKDRLSGYDDMIKRHCKNNDWDWRLISSIAYQESKFVHESESHRGAYGLFQIQPATADFLGIEDFDMPENNTRASIKLLNWLNKEFTTDSIPDDERLNFVLAAYNAGIGRIEECRKFAELQERNPNKWGEITEVIPLMRDPENVRAANLRLGTFNGTETMNFVSQIRERYEHYKRLLPE